MNYQNDELLDALAAQYVLGTMRGKARDRFERIKFVNELAREKVDYWEAQLCGLSNNLESREPSHEVWRNIQTRLGHIKVLRPASKAQTPTKPNFWPWFSGLAVAASLVLAVLLVRVQTPIIEEINREPVAVVAVFNDSDSRPLWVIDVTDTSIVAKATKNVPILTDFDYELWMVPSAGQAPISLGILKQNGEVVLTKPDLFEQLDLAALAISKEALGGSVTGEPTEVLFIAELSQIET